MFKSENISPLRRVFQNASILLSGDIGANIFKLMTLSIFSHSQGVEKLGYYVLFLSFIEAVDRFFNFQTWQAFIKFAALFQNKKERQNLLMLLKYSFLVDLISLIVASVVAILLSKFFIDFFNIPEEYYISLLFMCLTLLFKVIDLSTGIFRLYNRFAVQAKIALYTSALRFILYGLIAWLAPRFELFIYATVLTQFINMIMKYLYVIHVLKEQQINVFDILKQKVNMPIIKELKVLSFIVYNNFDSALRLFTTQLDVFLLGRFYGSELVGVYKITKEMSKLVIKVSSPVYQSIYPEFSKLIANKNFTIAKTMAIKISTYAGLMGIVFYGLFYLVGEQLIILAFGVEMIEAYSVSMFYIFAVLVNLISLPFPSLMHAMGLAKHAFYNQFFSSILYCLVLFYLVNQFSIYGAAVSMIIYHLLWLLGSIIIITQYKRQ